MAVLFESVNSDAILFSLTLAIAVYWWLSHKYSYWSSRGVPAPKPHLFFGNFRDLLLRKTFRGKEYQKIYNYLEEHKFGGMYFLIKPALILKDPELIKDFLVKDFAHFQDRVSGEGSNYRNPMNMNLVTLKGQQWKNLRSKLSTTFTSAKMKAMCTTMLDRARELTSNMKIHMNNEGCADVKDVCARFTIDVVAACVFGLHTDSITNPDSAFKKLGLKFNLPSLRLFIASYVVKHLPAFVEEIFDYFRDREIEEFFYRYIKENVKLREESNTVKNDFLQLLIDMKNNEKAEKVPFSDDLKSNPEVLNERIYSMKEKPSKLFDFDIDEHFMVSQCIAFFVGGFETTATTMSLCLYELAVNLQIQDELRQEIDTVLEKYSGQLTYGSLQEMKYLDCVIDETLRKHPPLGALLRNCNKPYVIPGTEITVEKNMEVRIPVYALHHDAKYYPDPEKFDPNRFTEENKNKRPQYTYLPFGEGPRMCIGIRFSRQQAKVGLAALISKFKFTPCAKTPMPLRFEEGSLITSAKGELWLQVMEVENNIEKNQ